MKNFMTLILLIFSVNVFAQHDHGSDKLVDTAEATSEALAYFAKNSNHGDIDAFKGVKAWPVTGGIKVKVYLNDNRGDLEYACHRHSANEHLNVMILIKLRRTFSALRYNCHYTLDRYITENGLHL